ncbi:hypothetical protein NDI37_25305 [Funiculus sociatus GB2-A5]|uniref:Uncharacterized protein n=1 Tax=Funiculus sociatus GB2-A5 TaxID=2933946 RepID=A0ABV0JWF4_9CYAN|nr:MULTISPECIES: hypothetical protein [unclassified Trichocoleus]MBD1905094.1 hypothetical protein [Trichocoleus sp. FACHB-832]MBD2062628.1 hypothetical protein [Trichocoleus sp. FACHB-6]
MKNTRLSAVHCGNILFSFTFSRPVGLVRSLSIYTGSDTIKLGVESGGAKLLIMQSLTL